MRTDSIVLIGSPERRAQMKACLGLDAAAIAGEIAGDDPLRLIACLAPDLVLLDGAAAGANPLVLLPALAALENAPQVIVLASSGSALERGLLIELGAQAVGRLEQPASLREALARLAGPVADRQEGRRPVAGWRWNPRETPAIERPRNRAA